MPTSLSRYQLASVLALLLLGIGSCSSSEETTPVGPGLGGASGAAADSGTGGTAGTAGAAGTGGTSGKGGTGGAAGTAGVAGSSGTGGTAGAGGTSGNAGTAGIAGTGGAAGDAGSGGTAGSGPSGYSSLTVGYLHTCAIANGALLCWGENNNGVLGDGTNTPHSTPTQVKGFATGAAAVSGGAFHTCAVTTGGGVKCWGENQKGQLGNGTSTDTNAPVDVTGLSSGIKAVSAGSYYSCALSDAGGVKCWGDNEYGSLGNGANAQQKTPVDVQGLSSGVLAITTGGYHACALLGTGGIKCWGNNALGQLGDGTKSHTNTPHDVPGLTSGVAAVAARAFHTCAIVSGGGLKCWGENKKGEVGDGTQVNKLSPVDVVGFNNGVSSVGLGAEHTCLITTAGGLHCFGFNEDGQLGDGTTVDKSSPVAVTGLDSGVVFVSGGSLHTCALLGTGQAKCWGNNISGQLGDGTTTHSTTPVDVIGP